MSYYHWRYLLHGKVKHALRASTSGYAACGTGPSWFAPSLEWRGTGTQDEYDRVRDLPTCKKCARIAGDAPTTGYEWSYMIRVGQQLPKYKHAVRKGVAFCGARSAVWRRGDSPVEREQLARLPACHHCANRPGGA